MSKIYDSVDQLIGKTPLIRVKSSFTPDKFSGELLLKLESANPAGSVKDRIAKAMIDAAEKEGKLVEGGTIIEPTSGNTGIALAAIGAARNYDVILVMPDTMSKERRKMLKAYGAKLVLTPGDAGMPGAIEKANELAQEIEHSFVPSQFENQENVRIHYETTGPEIWSDTDGTVDAVVSGIGTGGTITGAGKYLKEKNSNIKMIAVEPTGSPILAKGEKGKHKIQGIGAGFVPKILDTDIYDEIMLISDEDAMATGRRLGVEEGIFVGISAGAAVKAALDLIKKENFQDKTIVVILPDSGDRYLSVEGYIE